MQDNIFKQLQSVRCKCVTLNNFTSIYYISIYWSDTTVMFIINRAILKFSDVNECEIEGSCSQICINEKGTYKCECEPGYLRDPQDHTRCKAMEGHASLLFSMQHNIRKISLDHHEMSAIINSTKSATAIDFVFRTGMIYWGDVSEKKIYK